MAKETPTGETQSFSHEKHRIRLFPLKRNRQALSRFLRAAGCTTVQGKVPPELELGIQRHGKWRVKPFISEWRFSRGTLEDFHKWVTNLFAPKNRPSIYNDDFSPALAFTLFLIEQVPGAVIEDSKKKSRAANWMTGKKPGRKHGEETLRRVRLRNEKHMSHGQIADVILADSSLTPLQKKREKPLLVKDIGKSLKAYRESIRDKEYFSDPRKLFLGLRHSDEITILEVDGRKA